MFSSGRNDNIAEILSGDECRRCYTTRDITIVQHTVEPGMTVSHVARLHDVNANQLFKWRKQCKEGSLTAITSGEEVVLALTIKQIRECQGRLRTETMENKILTEAIGIPISRSPLRLHTVWSVSLKLAYTPSLQNTVSEAMRGFSTALIVRASRHSSRQSAS